MGTEAIGRALGASARFAVRGTNRRGQWFFTGFALACAATVFVGFARTYYLKPLFGAPSLPLLFHIHGALFTAWILLFVTQALLVAKRRTALHRRLGIVAGLLVVPMLVTGVVAAILAARGEGPVSAAARRGEFATAAPAIPPLVGLIVPLTSVMLFSTFVALGLGYRRRPDMHKRLMALGAIAMLPPALGRAIGTLTGIGHPALFFGATILFIVGLGIYDLRTRRRVHLVTVLGGLALFASFPARLAIGNTNVWLTFAGWLIR